MANSFTIAIDDFDALNGVWHKVVKTYQITDGWRRGFAVAIGVCEGSSERGPGQTKVYQTLAEEVVAPGSMRARRSSMNERFMENPGYAPQRSS